MDATDPREPGDRPASRPTALTSLSPSLLMDLQRADLGSPQRELLEVLAAGVRHTQPLAIDLVRDGQPLTLSIFPLSRRAHAPMTPAELLQSDLAALQVRRVRPATTRPVAESAPPGTPPLDPAHEGPLNPLLWAIALRGARGNLLPELAGKAAYRVSPGLDLDGLVVPASMAACIRRLRQQTCNLDEIAGWPQIGQARAMRLLNALYLQSGLIVSRTHPAATNEGWTGYR